MKSPHEFLESWWGAAGALPGPAVVVESRLLAATVAVSEGAVDGAEESWPGSAEILELIRCRRSAVLLKGDAEGVEGAVATQSPSSL